MMEKRAGIASLGGAKVLVGTALVSLYAMQCAYAQDGGINTRFATDTNESIPNEPEKLATNFAMRWSGEAGGTKEFVLGSDGVVKDNNRANIDKETSDVQLASPSNIGSTLSAYSEETPSKVPPVAVVRPTGSVTQIGVVAGASPSPSMANECGASPMKPVEIKALVEETARRHGVDEKFAVAITWAESRFDEVRNSPKGARGPMQLIPDTAARFGVADICDPAQNIEGGVKYLRELLDEFQNPLLVAAAYNSGENRIYEYGGVPPFQETVGYIAKVVNYQLGLSMPEGKRKAGNVVRDVAATTTGSATGVIAVEKSGKFVGGVMHF